MNKVIIILINLFFLISCIKTKYFKNQIDFSLKNDINNKLKYNKIRNAYFIVEKLNNNDTSGFSIEKYNHFFRGKDTILINQYFGNPSIRVSSNFYYNIYDNIEVYRFAILYNSKNKIEDLYFILKNKFDTNSIRLPNRNADKY